MIDPEKIADAPRNDITYAGMPLISRYGKRHELETMMAAIDWIIDRDPATVHLIVELFCDSKAQATYTVACHADGPCSAAEVQMVGDMLDQALRTVAGGHNGIYVDPAEKDLALAVDPWWSDELF